MATADKLALLKATKADLKTALTEQGQSPGDVFETYPDLVRAIQTGVTLPTLTSPGAAADLRQGKQLIDQSGAVVDGTLVEVEQATPSISVSSAGLITATAGDKSATKQLTTQSGKTVTPGTSDQVAIGSGVYSTGTVWVAGDADLIPENIKSGVQIFDVLGTLEGGATVKTFSKYDVAMEEVEYTYNAITRWGTRLTITVEGLTSTSQLVGFGASIKYDNTGNGFIVFGPSSYSDWPILSADTNGNTSRESYLVEMKNGSIVLTGDGSFVYGFLAEEGLENPSDWNDCDGWIAFM